MSIVVKPQNFVLWSKISSQILLKIVNIFAVQCLQACSVCSTMSTSVFCLQYNVYKRVLFAVQCLQACSVCSTMSTSVFCLQYNVCTCVSVCSTMSTSVFCLQYNVYKRVLFTIQCLHVCFWLQVKYSVRSIKEFCGTGEMGPGTVSMVSVSTDVDTHTETKIVRSHTFV